MLDFDMRLFRAEHMTFHERLVPARGTRLLSSVHGIRMAEGRDVQLITIYEVPKVASAGLLLTGCFFISRQ
jgi:hypothetical protein